MSVFQGLFFSLLVLPAVAAAEPELQNGTRIKARGHFDGQRFQAESVRLKDARDDDTEIVGRIEATDDSGRFRLHGIWIAIDETELNRRTRRWVRRIEPGDWAKVEGHWTSGNQLLADSVERPARDKRQDAIEGLVAATRADAKGAPLIAVGPFSIETHGETQWRGFE